MRTSISASFLFEAPSTESRKVFSHFSSSRKWSLMNCTMSSTKMLIHTFFCRSPRNFLKYVP